jgi:hypothetical protein
MSFEHLSYRLSRTCAFILLVALAACGGSGSSTTGTGGTTDCTHPTVSDQNGCAYVALTDSPGDFLSYTVSVKALTLTRSDGTIVNLLPNATTIDFAQYSDLSEFLTLASMPIGGYTSGSITLDYTDADIVVQDSSGNALQVMPVDASGNPVTTMTLAINMDSQGALELAPGVPQLFQVDFDLDASNTVDLSTATVTVQPFLVTSVDPNLSNQVQVRGPLASVDVASDSFTLGLRPFYALSGDYGSLRVFTDSSTVYDINQTGYSGNAGLTALAAAGTTTAIIARGTFDFNTQEFIATEVDAGSSVPGGTLDAAEGVVLSRSGDNIVLRGATLYRAGQTAIFRDSVAVTLGTGTKVHKTGSPKGSFDISDISVGQRLLVFGTLTNTNPTSLALDASSGFARLRYTKFDGTVSVAPTFSGGNGSMAVDAQYIEGRPVAMFNFAGTGTSTATDATPASYAVSSTASVLNGIAMGDPVRVWGFVTPFGSAPPDFTATSVADYLNANARLIYAWTSPGTSSAFTSMGSTSGLLLNAASSPIIQDLRQGGIVSTPAAPPTVQATLGIFAIAQNGTVQLHVTFAGFLSDLTARLSAGGKVRLFFARGGYSGSTSTMQAKEIAVIIQ